ncbi:MAG: AraC family transcriptional regulator [Pseudomonadota bacterium]
MKSIDKALWYIEHHYKESIALDELARVAGVSRYHLSRIFCYAIGQPISRYIRMRRLSTAAIALAAGENDILDLALAIGYGSHEAFSRAFKTHFAVTPEQVRRQGHTQNLELTEAINMQSLKPTEITEPRSCALDAFQVIGSARHYTFDRVAEIPDQWQSFTPHIAPLKNGKDYVDTYGVIFNAGEESFDYLSGVAVTVGQAQEDALPNHLVSLQMSAQQYLVFHHPGHVATLRETCHTIWSHWLPESKYVAVQAPWFEHYGAAFDPVTGAGGVDIWIPVKT